MPARVNLVRFADPLQLGNLTRVTATAAAPQSHWKIQAEAGRKIWSTIRRTLFDKDIALPLGSASHYKFIMSALRTSRFMFGYMNITSDTLSLILFTCWSIYCSEHSCVHLKQGRPVLETFIRSDNCTTCRL